jgi:holdfast attachment protein HfaA
VVVETNSPSVAARRRGSPRVVALTMAAAAVTLATPAAAQTMSGSASQFNGGYGGSAGLNQPVNVSTRDENNNQVFINGSLQAPAGSVFSRSSGWSQNSSSGVGGSGLATAIGNNLTVVVQGSWNRVTVDSTQINNGDVSATTSLNGQVNLDGP